MRYLISYDIRGNNRGKDRDDLEAFLKELGAVRVLKSQWVAKLTDTNADELMAEIFMEPFIKGGDRLLISNLSVRLNGDSGSVAGYASFGLLDEIP